MINNYSYKLILIVTAFLIPQVCLGQTNSSAIPKSVTTSEREMPSYSPFRYVIIGQLSEIEKVVNENEDNRYLEVLLRDDDFTEKNLTTLFGLLDERIKDKPYFLIHVTTSLEAIYTPEEFDQLGGWGAPPNSDKFKYAFFFRVPAGKWIDYSIPGKIKDKKVWISKK